jgi:hypothetical protein
MTQVLGIVLLLGLGIPYNLSKLSGAEKRIDGFEKTYIFYTVPTPTPNPTPFFIFHSLPQAQHLQS